MDGQHADRDLLPQRLARVEGVAEHFSRIPLESDLVVRAVVRRVAGEIPDGDCWGGLLRHRKEDGSDVGMDCRPKCVPNGVERGGSTRLNGELAAACGLAVGGGLAAAV